MSAEKDVIFSISFAATALGMLYIYARLLMLKTLFVRQLDALHERVAQGLPLEGAVEDLPAIPWQTVVDEASESVRGRIDRGLFVHPVYRDAVNVYKDLEARYAIAMLVLVVVGGGLTTAILI